MATFHVNIVSADKNIYSAEVISLIVPSALGYLGILANHAPLVARLGRGKIIIRDSHGQPKIIEIGGSGFMEVLKNSVSIIL